MKTTLFSILFSLSLGVHSQPQQYSEAQVEKLAEKFNVSLPKEEEPGITVARSFAQPGLKIINEYIINREKLLNVVFDTIGKKHNITREDVRNKIIEKIGSLDKLVVAGLQNHIEIKKQLLCKATGEGSLRDLTSHGVKLIHNLYDMNEILLLSFTFDKHSCQPTKTS